MAQDSRGIVREENLQNKLNEETGEGKTEVSDIGEEFEILFIDTNRFYTLDKNGNVIGPNKFIEDKYPGDIAKDKNGDILDGSDEHPYEIWCIEDLIELSENYINYQNCKVILCRNLNFKSNLSYAYSNRIDYGDINKDGITESLIKEMQTGIGFTPILLFSRYIFTVFIMEKIIESKIFI